ncbi:MAG TPA: T9SS type A sorting domain-containing protein [Flavobacterium sp.]|nr:T9SS type A sorting domain-containing protein [Flavobacterium sp.]
MKKITPLSTKLILMFFCLFLLGNIYGQNKNQTNKTLFGKPVKAGTINPNKGLIRCATTEYEEFLQEKNPKRMSNAQFEAWLNPLVAKYKVAKANSKTAATIITIPVVVHVVHSGQAIGTAPNTTDAQIQSQITVLNQDFRKLLGTPGYNENPVGADVEIEFVLAKQDPNGNPTNGIDRVNFTQPSWSEYEIETILKPNTIWDPASYLNMWSLKFTDNTLLGYAQFPDGSSLGGLSASGGPANTDGVVSSYDVFGSSDFGGSFLLAPPYNKGRTMTHEVGHWLGLLHIWGDGGSRDSNTKDCNASDFCDDTPISGWENYDCLTTYDSCPTDPGSDMTENYMDYTNDECMNIFTQNQKDRITVIMNNAARRSSLKTSTKATAIPLVANDAEVKIVTFNSNTDYGCNATPPPPTNKVVSIYNRGTSTLTSVTLNYNINGGANQTHTWTGSLTQNQSVDVTLLNTNFNGTLNVSIATANGGTDQRVSNNSASRNYFDVATVNYNFTNFVFTLQQDFWGSEITWEVKDALGVVKYSGGPYTDIPESSLVLPELITQNWTLDSNQCYTFTINDSAEDGICCSGGDGYYNIKSTDGSTTIASGASYGIIENKYFSTNALGTTTFEALNDIYLYPNPTKETLNIHVSNTLGLPNRFTISNSLGQIISRKAVSKQADLTVNTSSLSNGVYFITVTKEDQSKTLQFIKE